jgi:hypothetical protein
MVLFHQVSGALLDATNQLLGRPDAEVALSYEGDSEDYGRSLVGVIVQLADNHWSMAGTMERRYALMQQMLGFTRHPYMQLSWDALGFWAALLKDAGVYPGAQKSPITSPREQQQQQQQGFPGSAAAPAAAGSTGGGPQSRSHLVPPECCQVSLARRSSHSMIITCKQSTVVLLRIQQCKVILHRQAPTHYTLQWLSIRLQCGAH